MSHSKTDPNGIEASLLVVLFRKTQNFTPILAKIFSFSIFFSLKLFDMN